MRPGFGAAVLTTTLVVAAGQPGFASAALDCARAPTARTLLAGQGLLESITAGAGGRLFFTSSARGGSVMTLDRHGLRTPSVLVGPIEAPGGLVFSGGDLIVGSGNSLAGGATGNVNPAASLIRVDPATGRQSVFAKGLAMGNGLAKGRDGTIYASDDLGTGIDRVRRGAVENRWANVISGNGLAVSGDGRYLYAAQTFQPAAIRRVEIANPGRVTTYARPPASDIAGGPDGMTIDPRDRLFVAVNAAGEVWRVDRRHRICVVARGIPQASALAFGRGRRGFGRQDLYVVNFGGKLVELPDARRARFPG